MQQIIYFIRKFRYFLLFIILEIIAFSFTIQHHSYHKSKFVNSANAVTGGLYSQFSSINDFFTLRSENNRLNIENNKLKNKLEQIRNSSKSSDSLVTITNSFGQKYEYISGKVIKNDYSSRNNYLTLNKGENSSITPDMGVINSLGVIGVIESTSSNYASVLSILNSNSQINVRLKNSNHFGILTWNGKEPNVLQIIDIPRQAIIKKGDSVITGGKSAIFPEGIQVGIVKDFSFENNLYNEINIELFNDMTSLGHIQIVRNLERTEQKNLEQNSVNE